MPESRLARCRAAYANPVNYECGDVVVPAFSDDESPNLPPRHDDVWDQLPILERGWNVIEGEN